MKSLPYIFGILALATGLFSPMAYRTTEETINNRSVVHHVLDLDMNDQSLQVDHGLSMGVLYGFETTSEILVREEALHGVNGMFYDEFGLPLGSLIQEGVPISIQNYETPSLLISDANEVTIAENTIQALLATPREVISMAVNGPVPDGTWGLFTQDYGSSTRIWRPSINYILEKGVVIDVIEAEAPVKLNLGDQVLSYVGKERVFQIGDTLEINYDYSYKEFDIYTGIQTGGWLVRDGINVAQNLDPFAGYTTAPQPRTLVGVTDDNHLLLVVVDGRQPGYSIGVTGVEAADLMIEYGCINAAYMDGGNSSTMVYNGEIVNQYSGSKERKVAHAIVIREVVELTD